jgi:hypothetical protein
MKREPGVFERNQIKNISKPPYSPNIAPRDFVVRHAETKTWGQATLDEHELIEVMNKILANAKKGEFINVLMLRSKE